LRRPRKSEWQGRQARTSLNDQGFSPHQPLELYLPAFNSTSNRVGYLRIALKRPFTGSIDVLSKLGIFATTTSVIRAAEQLSAVVTLHSIVPKLVKSFIVLSFPVVISDLALRFHTPLQCTCHGVLKRVPFQLPDAPPNGSLPPLLSLSLNLSMLPFRNPGEVRPQLLFLSSNGTEIIEG
jgi:hypothetical protein